MILNQDKTLNRKNLANIVFSDKELLQTLNKISHKYILEKTRDILKDYKNKGYRFAVVDAPLLFEAQFDKECNITISVLAHHDIRKSRIILRDKLTESDAEKRIKAQNPDEFYIEKSNYVVYNNNDKSELEKSFLQIMCSIGG